MLGLIWLSNVCGLWYQALRAFLLIIGSQNLGGLAVEKDYERYFATQLKGYKASPPHGARLESDLVADALDRVMAHGIGLRADAQLFLYLNFVEFVAVPVRAIHPSKAENLKDDIEADMHDITSEARVLSENSEVTVHSVVNATSTRWQNLRTKALRVWE